MESNLVFNHTNDTARESDLFITSMIRDRIERDEIFLPLNDKNYNFREKRNSQAVKGK